MGWKTLYTYNRRNVNYHNRFLEAKDGIVQMKDTFNAAVINTLWQIVSSKQFDPDDPETKQIIMLLNSQDETRYSKSLFFPTLFKLLPMREVDRKLQGGNSMENMWLEFWLEKRLEIPF